MGVARVDHWRLAEIECECEWKLSAAEIEELRVDGESEGALGLIGGVSRSSTMSINGNSVNERTEFVSWWIHSWMDLSDALACAGVVWK